MKENLANWKVLWAWLATRPPASQIAALVRAEWRGKRRRPILDRLYSHYRRAAGRELQERTEV